MKLKISEDFSLPLELATGSIAMLAIKGSGKTYTSAVLTEELIGRGVPVIIIDPTGVHWGLKSSANGKSEGFPVTIFGGDHADLPLEEGAGEVLARWAVENRFSAIIDLSHFRKAQIYRFLTPFFETLYRLNRQPMHLVCDEADAYAPQKSYPDVARCLGAMEDIVRRGRARGIGSTLISQRPASLNKDVLTQCDCLVALRISHPRDVAPVMEWVDQHGDRAQAKQMVETLPSLPTGTAWVWAPRSDIFQKVQIRQRETFDSSITPKIGQVRAEPKVVAKIDLEALGKEIKATVERAKENDPAELKAKVRRLEAELAKKPTSAQVPSPDKSQSKLLNAYRRSLESAMKIIATINAASFSEASVKPEDVKQALETAAAQIGRQAESRILSAQKNLERIQAQAKRELESMRTLLDSGEIKISVEVVAQPKFRVATPASTRPALDSSSNGIQPSHRKVLAVLAQQGPCEKGKLSLLAGYTYSGGFRNILASLRTAGFLEGQNEGMMSITDAGLQALGPFDPLPTGSALAQFWMKSNRLQPAHKKVLGVLLDQPQGMSAEDLAVASGYEYSGGFRNILSTLRTTGVMVGKNTDTLRASENLFD